LALAKLVRDAGGEVGCAVNHYRQQEQTIVGHQVRAFDREFPFQTEVALATGVGVCRDKGDEQCTIPNLPAKRHIPRIAAAKLALVEPDLDASGTQRIANMLCRFRILGRVAQEYGPGRFRHGTHVAGGRSRELFGIARSTIQGLFDPVPIAYPKA
jgi:hypothetical protein